MIAKKIYEQAKLHVDDDFAWQHAKRWLNEGLKLLATVCENGSKVMETITLTATQADYYAIPIDSIGVSAVYKDSVSRINRIQNYVEDGSRLWIPEEGVYYVEYHRPASEIALESDVPEVHEMYHIPLSYWIASREKLRFNPQDADGIRLQGEFYSQVRSVDYMLGLNRRVRKVRI